MELKLQNGDYVPDGVGGLRRVWGQEALLQRVFYKLMARRGQFPFWEDLGSRLWKLGQIPPADREAAAAQYVTEALADEPELSVRNVTLTWEASTAEITVELNFRGETLAVSAQIQ